MNYQTFKPHPDLAALVKCYWTLEVPAEHAAEKQRIIPDGCIEMAFILGHDIRRFVSKTESVIQPRAMVVGQITKPFYIQPTGYVNTFAIRFYPYGFSNFVDIPIRDLCDRETPIGELFGNNASSELEQQIISATDTAARIQIIEKFLITSLHNEATIDKIVRSTVDTLAQTKGNSTIKKLLEDDLSKRRLMERKFSKQVGISPKQLSKIIRLQAALKMLLTTKSEKLSHVAYENEYYDQAHFIRDFREFTGTTPKEFSEDKSLVLSSMFYKND